LEEYFISFGNLQSSWDTLKKYSHQYYGLGLWEFQTKIQTSSSSFKYNLLAKVVKLQDCLQACIPGLNFKFTKKHCKKYYHYCEPKQFIGISKRNLQESWAICIEAWVLNLSVERIWATEYQDFELLKQNISFRSTMNSTYRNLFIKHLKFYFFSQIVSYRHPSWPRDLNSGRIQI